MRMILASGRTVFRLIEASRAVKKAI